MFGPVLYGQAEMQADTEKLRSVFRIPLQEPSKKLNFWYDKVENFYLGLGEALRNSTENFIYLFIYF